MFDLWSAVMRVDVYSLHVFLNVSVCGHASVLCVVIPTTGQLALDHMTTVKVSWQLVKVFHGTKTCYSIYSSCLV